MTTNQKPAQVFSIIRNFRTQQQKKRTRKGSFNVGPLRNVQRKRKMTETYDSTDRLFDRNGLMEIQDVLVPQSLSQDVQKPRVDDLEQSIPIQVTEEELDADSMFTLSYTNSKVYETVPKDMRIEEYADDDITI